jgi:hypothetical protein
MLIMQDSEADISRSVNKFTPIGCAFRVGFSLPFWGFTPKRPELGLLPHHPIPDRQGF